MPTVTRRPNFDIGWVDDAYGPGGGGLVLNGSATMSGALGDDSDGSYLLFNPSDLPYPGPMGAFLDNPKAFVGIQTAAIPAGNVIKYLVLRARAAQPALNNDTIHVGFATSNPSQYLVPNAGAPIEPTSLQAVPLTFTSAPIYTTPTNSAGYYSGGYWTQADLDRLAVSIGYHPNSAAPKSVYVYEIYVDITYAAPPTVTVQNPTGTVAISNPIITWTYTPGADGSEQTASRVKLFTTAQFSAGGFNPATSTPTWDSGIVSGATTSRQINLLLANTTFRAYVQVAQVTSGVTQWSAWAYSQFVVSVAGPGAPTIGVAPNSPLGRIDVTVTKGANPAWTAAQVQRSADGGVTWTDLRDYALHDVTGLTVVTIADYEAPADASIQYRARGVIIAVGGTIAGDWSAATSPVTWGIPFSVLTCDGAVAWLKDPLDPNTNMLVRLGPGSLSSKTRRGTRGVFDILGRQRPVVVSDTRRSIETTLTILTNTAAEAAQLVALFSAAPTLLLQAPTVFGWESAYISAGDLVEAQVIPNISRAERLFTVPITVTDAPAGISVAVINPPLPQPAPGPIGAIRNASSALGAGTANNATTTASGANVSVHPTMAIAAGIGFNGSAATGGAVLTWQPLKIGAGGYITGISISDDGTCKAIRTDTYGGYVSRNNGDWYQVVTATSMPAGEVLPNSAFGVFEIAVAPNTPSRIYMAWKTSVYRSDDYGLHWSPTALTGKTFDPNTVDKLAGAKMIVDPVNPDVVYFGVLSDNLYVTINGGASWSTVSTSQIPVAGVYGYAGMYFDPSGGTSGARTNNIYIASHTHGLYRSTNQGSTFTHITGGPNLTTDMVTRAGLDTTNGVYHACTGPSPGAEDSVWRYTPSGNTWFQGVGPDGNIGPHGITVNPANNLHVVFQRMSGGGVGQSNDGGTTWDLAAIFPPFTSWTATDVPWLADNAVGHGSGGDIMFDPVVANRIWNVEGISPWYATVTYGLTSIPWVSKAVAIEQLVVNRIIAPPGHGGVLVAVWDRGTFLLTDLANYPASSQMKPNTLFDATWELDYAGGSSPSFIVGNHSDNQGNREPAGYSIDGGTTWTQFATKPLGATTNAYVYGFGAIAVSTDTQHIVWVGAPNQWPYYTANRGGSWAPCSIAGLSNPADAGAWIWGVFLNRHIAAADKVNANTMYLYASDTGNPAKRGFYRSTDGGANFTRVGPSAPITADISGGTPGEAVYWANFNATLSAAPGHAGHLWFTGGHAGSSPDSLTVDGFPFIRSVDGGVTWSVIPNVREVYCFGFGKDSGSGYPAIFIVGWVGGVYGVWRSYDAGVSWTNIGTWPLGSLDFPTTCSGDMDVVGRVYVGFRGSGAAYRDS